MLTKSARGMAYDKKMENKKSLVVITWDGINIPLYSVDFDSPASFNILLFNYSGNDKSPIDEAGGYYQHLLSVKTECKGQVILAVYNYLRDKTEDYEYIGFIDDDILIRASDINYMLKIAVIHQLDTFQPSISHDSYHSHRRYLHNPYLTLASVRWVEIMSPFFRKELFEAAADFYSQTISSYGIDCYVMPFYQKLLHMERSAVIHAVVIKHYRPVTPGEKKYSNQLTAYEEKALIRTAIINLIKTSYADKFDAAFMAEVYGVGRGFFYYAGVLLNAGEKITTSLIQSLKTKAVQ